MKGRVFNIQRFSVHDGPGIRTTFFFKGCNLRCRWCHNPESYEIRPQIQYFKEKCIGCGACMEVCKQGIRIEQGRRIGTEHCILCRACEDACLTGALKFAGEEYFSDELISVALEAVLPYTDLVLLDLKIMEEKAHQAYTGVSNRRILENAKRLMDLGVRMYIRVPVIAGVNDTLENGLALKMFIDEAPCVEEVRFLPYHDMGLSKAASVNVEMAAFAAPSAERMQQLRDLFGKIGR